LLSAEIGCGVLGFCPKPFVPEFNATFETPKPPVQPYPSPAESDESFFFLHLSDIHIDPEYTPGLATDCGEPICCRPPNPIGKYANNTAGIWGDYNCDSPAKLYTHALNFIQQKFPNLSMAIVTGDLPAHNFWEVSREQAKSVEDSIADEFYTRFPNIPFYAAVGNHESVPANQFVPRDMQPKPVQFDMAWLYDSLAQKWSKWLPEDAVNQARHAGFYSTIIPFSAHDEYPLRIISLNTNLGCNKGNWWLKIPTKAAIDPDQMIQWTIDELAKAEKNGERVFLIEHLAISAFCDKNWKSWNEVLDRFENTIIGHFAGHTHDDTFTITYDKSLKPIGSIHYAGSITTQGRNPGFRIYKVDRKTKAVLDYTEYWADLSEANANPAIGPQWKLQYTASEAYEVKNLSPLEWHNLASRMKQKPELAQSFILRKTKLYGAPCISENCLKQAICGVISAPPGVNASSLCQ
jgi:sphingomyelin phosphodiesterase